MKSLTTLLLGIPLALNLSCGKPSEINLRLNKHRTVENIEYVQDLYFTGNTKLYGNLYVSSTPYVDGEARKDLGSGGPVWMGREKMSDQSFGSLRGYDLLPSDIKFGHKVPYSIDSVRVEFRYENPNVKVPSPITIHISPKITETYHFDWQGDDISRKDILERLSKENGVSSGKY
ncbi:MAG TPA: hypothetical protein VJJ23_01445 [Candidatus Nanoarchaeia archaeon]|nr:hypothetical protein [Candidatus Nanoarchaeia archaeon]